MAWDQELSPPGRWEGLLLSPTSQDCLETPWDKWVESMGAKAQHPASSCLASSSSGQPPAGNGDEKSECPNVE